MHCFGCSQRDALRLVKMSASTYLYKPVKKDESALKMRTKEITQTRVHYGYRRVHVLARREGHKDLRLARLPPVPGGRPVAAAQAASAEQGRPVAPAEAVRTGHQRDLEHGHRGRRAGQVWGLKDRLQREPTPLCTRMGRARRIRTTLQTCIVHLIRKSLDCASWKDRKVLAAAPKPIYTAPGAEAAAEPWTRLTAALGARNSLP
jgi:hypothetical protein